MGQGVLARKVQMRKVVVTLALLLAGCGSASAFEYVNPSAPKQTAAIEVDSGSVVFGHRAMDATFCSRGDRFVCVVSEPLTFAVPAPPSPIPPQWIHAGKEYKLVRREKLHLLGTTNDVFEIESEQGIRRFRYFYSRKNGLLVFRIEIEGAHSSFVSDGRQGFGAVSDR